MSAVYVICSDGSTLHWRTLLHAEAAVLARLWRVTYSQHTVIVVQALPHRVEI